jgi:hypothetical protein
VLWVGIVSWVVKLVGVLEEMLMMRMREHLGLLE